MAVARRSDGKRKGAGRRAHYAPKAHEVGIRRHLPVGWADWLGFGLFGFVAIACVAGAVKAAVDSHYPDIFAALLIASLAGWMTYLFATTRFEDS